jgi:hypothetical protein
MPRYVSEKRRAEAQTLRDQGKSYNYISAAIGLSKGTLSYWWGKEVAAKTKKRTTDNRKERDKYIQEYKESRGCQDCRNEGYPGMHPYYVLDADHVRGKKKLNLSRASRTGDLKLIKEELAKCDIVCANHHRIRTHKRKQFKQELNATEE